MLDAEPLQLGFVLLEFGDGFAASIIAQEVSPLLCSRHLAGGPLDG
jgi:hypothetical protein